MNFGGIKSKRVRNAILAMKCTDFDIRIKYQQSLVDQILKRASATAYGKGRSRSVDQWPVLQKASIRERSDDFVASNLVKIPAGTSGTSGQPLKLWRGVENIIAEQCFLDHCFQLGGGIRKFSDAKVAILRGDAPRGAGDQQVALFERLNDRRLILSSTNLSADTFDTYVDEIRKFQPDALWVYPTAGDNLASLCIARGLRLNVRTVLSSSEMLGEGALARMQRAFGSSVVDYYGQAERVCLAVKVDQGEWYFQPAYGLVELVATDLNSDEVGVRLARIIATGFWNDAMPLIRYDTGDLIAYRANKDPRQLEMIGIGVSSFLRLHGRAQHYLRTKSGGFIQALGSIVKDIPGIRQAQFIQERDLSVELRIVVDNNFGKNEHAMLRACLSEALAKQVSFSIAVVDTLERSSGGKTQFVIRR